MDTQGEDVTADSGPGVEWGKTSRLVANHPRMTRFKHCGQSLFFEEKLCFTEADRNNIIQTPG